VKNIKSITQFVVLLSVGILFIYLSLKQVAPYKEQIIDAFKNANYFWVLITLIISFLSHFLRAYRWNFLLAPLGYKTNLFNATAYVLVGYFANYGIPRMGEITRCTLATKYDKVPFDIAFGTVITERIIDFILFLFIFILTLAFQFKELIGLVNEYILFKISLSFFTLSKSPLKIIFIVVGFLGIMALFFILRKKTTQFLKGKFGGFFKGIIQGISSVRKMEKPIQFIVLSIMIWACYFYSLYFCFFALQGTYQLGQKECLTLLSFGTFGVIFSPGGLGAYPFIVGGILLNSFHIDQVSSFALPWLSWSSQFILILFFGVLSLFLLPIYNRKKNVVS